MPTTGKKTTADRYARSGALLDRLSWIAVRIAASASGASNVPTCRPLFAISLTGRSPQGTAALPVNLIKSSQGRRADCGAALS